MIFGPRIAQTKCKFLNLLAVKMTVLTTCRKHERKHTKPFKCRHAECMEKGVGFSTENDRDRHYKSGRHQEAPTKGALKGFICIACTDGKVKWWPRQDNFKAHCTRRHSEWNTKDLMKQYVHVVKRQTIRLLMIGQIRARRETGNRLHRRQ